MPVSTIMASLRSSSGKSWLLTSAIAEAIVVPSLAMLSISRYSAGSLPVFTCCMPSSSISPHSMRTPEDFPSASRYLRA